MEMEICAAVRPCMLVARFFHRHAHSRKLRHAHSHKAPALVIPFCLFTLQPHNPLLCLSSRFEEDTSQNAAGTRMIKVKFVLRRRCDFGQQFFVIGDDKLLGKWAPEAAIPMQWSEGHVWILQMDLLSGTCMEFKILLKADEELIEWQPGPNRKLEVLDSVTSLLVSVPWSDGERLENETVQFLEMSDAQRPHNMVEVAATGKSLSDGADNTENMDPVSDAASLLDVFDKPKTSADIETVISNAKDSVDKRQEVATELIIGDGGLDDKASEDFLTLYPIPESWYVEYNDIQASHNFTDPSPGLLEVNAKGRTLTSAPELSVNEEDEAGEKTFLSSELRNLIAEATSSEADNEHICEKENDEQLLDDEEPAPRNVATVLSITKPKDIQKWSVQKFHGPSGAVAKPEKELIVDLTVLDNEESAADEQLMDNVSAETGVTATVTTPAKNELPGVELSSDSKEFVGTKPAKEKERSRKGWSKLWDAIVQGRIA